MFTSTRDASPFILMLGVILIPVSVAAVSFWADSRNAERQRDLSEQIFARQERLTVTRMIDTYFEGVGNLLGADMAAEVRDRIVVARTRALLSRLASPADNAVVVRFIAELRADLLIRPARVIERSKSPYVSLAGVDLGGTNLSFVNLYQAELGGANLSGADLSWANLGGANLAGANLSGSVLQGADLDRARLRGANLATARLEGAGLARSDLREANLRGAVIGTHRVDDVALATEFKGAITTGAVWLDGTKCATGADCPR